MSPIQCEFFATVTRRGVGSESSWSSGGAIEVFARGRG